MIETMIKKIETKIKIVPEKISIRKLIKTTLKKATCENTKNRSAIKIFLSFVLLVILYILLRISPF